VRRWCHAKAPIWLNAFRGAVMTRKQALEALGGIKSMKIGNITIGGRVIGGINASRTVYDLCDPAEIIRQLEGDRYCVQLNS
jgi:hypothetical protein